MSLGKTLSLKHTGTNSYFCLLQKIRQLSGSPLEAADEGAEEAEEQVPKQQAARKVKKAKRKKSRFEEAGDVKLLLK